MVQSRKNASLSVPKEQAPINKRDSQLYVVFPIQHGGEFRNRYKDLIANILTTQLVNVFAKSAAQTKRGSIMTKTGILPESKSQIPPLFVLAAGEVLADLKIHSISMRTTAAMIDFLPHAPKPPTIKFKTGKGGISDSVIPVDESTTTMRDANGKIIALVQDQKYKPVSKDIGPMQYKIPFEKIILGLNKNPPEFEMVNVGQNGVLEFRVKSDDRAISSTIYKIDLMTDDVQQPLSSAQNRVSPAEAMQPTFWNPDWGNFKDKLQQGFPLEYKKEASQTYMPYEVYGRGELKENRLLITGDQDVHSMPRSSVYQLGDLATVPIDTHEEKGATELEIKIYQTHEMITNQKISQKMQEFKEHVDYLMSQAPAGFDEKNITTTEHSKFNDMLNTVRAEHSEEMFNFINNQNDILGDFLEESHSYIKDLGDMTPFEAYTWIRINLRQQELTQEYLNQPDKLQAQIDQVRVTTSIGLDHILSHNLDVDLNPVWFDHDPENCIKHVEKQLHNNQFVSGEVLERYMQELEYTPQKDFYLYEKNMPPGAITVSSQDPKYTNLTIDVARKAKEWLQNDPTTEIYIIDIYGKSNRMTVDSVLDKRLIKDILLVNSENKQKSVIHLNENKISSNLTGAKGREQVEFVLRKAGIDATMLRAIEPVSGKRKLALQEDGPRLH